MHAFFWFKKKNKIKWKDIIQSFWDYNWNIYFNNGKVLYDNGNFHFDNRKVHYDYGNIQFDDGKCNHFFVKIFLIKHSLKKSWFIYIILIKFPIYQIYVALWMFSNYIFLHQLINNIYKID